MNSTIQLGSEFGKNIVTLFTEAIDQGTKKAYQIYWDAFLIFLSHHWLAVIVVLTAILVLAVIKAVLGRWGMLGSLLYKYLYFGIIFIVGLIWGSDIFVSNLFSIACTLVLYPVCYFVVRIILKKTGLSRM